MKKTSIILILALSLVYPTLYSKYETLMNQLQQRCNAHDTLLLGDFSDAILPPPLRNFRIVHNNREVVSKKGLCGEGLEKVHASGSAQFTPDHFKKIRKRIHTHKPDALIHVVDLRQEHHGFIKSHNKAHFPICWYKSSMNCINWNKDRQTIKDTEMEELRQLLAQEKTQIFIKDSREWPLFGEPVTIPPTQSFSVYIKNALTEKQFVTSTGTRYKRFYIADHLAPTTQEVDAFVIFAQQLPENAWLHFHCRAGKGRTTTFLALYDMMHNAQILDADTIIKRQSALADYNLMGSDPNYVVAKLKKERLKLLYAFHRYAREQAPQFKVPFSEWFLQKQ